MIQQPFNEFETVLQKFKIKYLNAKTVLEIGCGDCSVFKNADVVADGFDIQLPENHTYRRVSNNINDFNISDYDAICLLGVLEHMEEWDISNLFNKLYSAKQIYVTVPNAESFHRRVGKRMGIIKDLTDLSSSDFEIGHKRYYTYRSLLSRFQELIDKGFKVSFIGSAGFKIDKSKSMVTHIHSIEYIEQLAEQKGWIGKNAFNGGELILILKNG